MVPNATIIYSDLHYSFTKDTQGGIRKAYNSEAVGNSLINILSTNKGERLMLPEFGANLRALLFEGMNEDFVKLVAGQIRTEIEKWDPRISILSIKFDQVAQELSMYITIRFSVKGSSQIEELTQLVS